MLETNQEAMSDPKNKDEMEPLLERLCLGELDPVGWRRVAELIRGNRSAAKRYIETAHYCETLREETAGSAHESLPLPTGDGGAPEDQGIPGLAQGLAHDPTRKSSPLVGRRSDSNDASRWSLSLITWGLAVSVAFFCGWMVSGQDADPARGRLATAMPRALPTLPGAARAEPLGRLIGLTPQASSDGLLRSLKIGSQLGRGEVFQLTRGSARLEIGGGEVLVKGPAELSAIDTRTVFVRQGSVTVRHPGRMTVQTPVAIVTGEAATFSVDANAGVGATITAIAGVIHADTTPERGTCNRDHACNIAAGEAIRFTATEQEGLLVERDLAVSDDLLVDWSDANNDLHPYEQIVLADEPLAYWSLYRIRRHRAVLDLTQNGFDGYAIGNWPTELSDVHATQTRGAYFDGESYVEIDRKPPLDLKTGFTIESWARVAGGPEYQSVFTSRWVLESNTPQEQCFGFTVYAGENDKWQVWTGSGEYGKNWQQLHGPANVNRNRWTHVTASFEPDEKQEEGALAVAGEVRLYVNGQQVAKDRHTMSLNDFEWPARIGAAEFVPQSLTSWLFRGELRDIAIYDHVLEPERIEYHSEQGRPAI